MMAPGILLLASCLLAHSAPACSYAHGPRHAIAHSIAEVNDPLSHGTLGDNLLSLNEAIQLYNRTITVAQLSPSEIMQLGGLGTDIAWARIDASYVPTITIETDLDVILDWPHGLLIEGYNGEAVLDFTHSTGSHGFRSMSNFCNWRNLEIVGGTYGIDLQQSNAAFGGTVYSYLLYPCLMWLFTFWRRRIVLSPPQDWPSVSLVIAAYNENLQSAEAQIRDADFASETANLAKLQIMQQAGLSVLAQAKMGSQS